MIKLRAIFRRAVWGLAATAGTAEAGPDLKGTLFFFGLFMLAIGLLSIIYPRLFWYLRIGHKIKVEGVSPGRLYLAVLRIGGILVCALAVWMLLNSF